MIVRREPRPLGQSEGEIWSQIVRDPFSITEEVHVSAVGSWTDCVFDLSCGLRDWAVPFCSSW